MKKSQNSKNKTKTSLKTTRIENGKFLNKKAVIALILAALILTGFVSNLIPFSYNTVRCGGLPVESTKFAAAYSYRLPGDDGYGIHPFSEYHYCTQAEIRATGGYHRDALTTEGKEERAKTREQIKELRTFSPSRLDFKFYIPSLEGYLVSDLRVEQVHSNTHALYTIIKDGKSIGQVRELKQKDVYNICQQSDPRERYCKVIGMDNTGRAVNREYTNTSKGWRSYYTGVNIEGTGIVLSTNNDKESIRILGSMTEYTE